MESLGGNSSVIDRTVAQTMAFFYCGCSGRLNRHSPRLLCSYTCHPQLLSLPC